MLLSFAEGRRRTGGRGCNRQKVRERFRMFFAEFVQDLDVSKCLKAAKDKLRHWVCILRKKHTSLWAQESPSGAAEVGRQKGSMSSTSDMMIRAENGAPDMFRQSKIDPTGAKNL